MHSSDFGIRQIIDGKTQQEWEKEFQVTGIIKHLQGLGWETYQWRFQELLIEGANRDKYIQRYGEPPKNLTHFAEFFSPYYHGYLRGDSTISLREAMLNCLNKAQKFAECEKATGHEYVPYKSRNGKEYDNGLVECKHCGFNGYTDLVESLKNEKDHYKNLLEFKSKEMAKMLRNAEEEGVFFNIFGDIIHKEDKY